MLQAIFDFFTFWRNTGWRSPGGDESVIEEKSSFKKRVHYAHDKSLFGLMRDR